METISSKTQTWTAGMHNAFSRSTPVAHKAVSSVPGDQVFLNGNGSAVTHEAGAVPVMDAQNQAPSLAAAQTSSPFTTPVTNTASSIPVSMMMESPQFEAAPLVNTAATQAAASVDQVEAAAAEVIEGDSEDHSVWIPAASSTLVHTPKTVDNMSKLAAAVNSKDYILLTGGTGAGKTAIVKYLAHMTRNPLRRVNLHDQTDEVELFGGYKPGADGGFVWKDGTITSAIRNGHWLLLDELNLADQAVLERMNPLLDGDGYIVLTEKEDKERVKVHSKTRIFATQNPASYEGRKELSAAMFDRFQRKVWVNSLPADELVQVLKADFLADRVLDKMKEQFPDMDKEMVGVLRGNVMNHPDKIHPATLKYVEGRYGNGDKEALRQVTGQFAAGKPLSSLPVSPKTTQILNTFLNTLQNPPDAIIDEKVLLQMSMFHSKMVESAEGRILGKKGGPYPFTLRDLLKLSKRIKLYHELNPSLNQFQLAWQQARDVYQARFMSDVDQKKVDNFLQTFFGDRKMNNAGEPPVTDKDITMEKVGNTVRIGDTAIPINAKGGVYVPDASSKLIDTPGTVQKLTRLARSVALDEPVLLVGPTAAGKTSLVRWLAHETNNEFRRVNLSNHTDTSELIGGYYPAVEINYDNARDAVAAFGKDAGAKKLFDDAVARAGKDVAEAFQMLQQNPENLQGDAAKDAQNKIRDGFRKLLEDQSFQAAMDGNDAASDARGLMEGAFQTVPGKFEWRDGIIIEAMKKGQWIVLDEINLAEPAVLERLNSLLDNDRAIVLTEHLGERVKADGNFRVFATMNPATSEYGGRKKLSPAMRNRFTEQWFPDITERSEILTIADAWVNDFKAGAQKTIDEFKGRDPKSLSREERAKLVPAIAFAKADTKKLAAASTDFIMDIRQKAKDKELPTAAKDGYHYTLRGLRAWLKYVKNNVGLPMQNPDDPTDRSQTKDLKYVFNEGAKGYFADGLSRLEDQQKVVALGEQYADKL